MTTWFVLRLCVGLPLLFGGLELVRQGWPSRPKADEPVKHAWNYRAFAIGVIV